MVDFLQNTRVEAQDAGPAPSFVVRLPDGQGPATGMGAQGIRGERSDCRESLRDSVNLCTNVVVLALLFLGSYSEEAHLARQFALVARARSHFAAKHPCRPLAASRCKDRHMLLAHGRDSVACSGRLLTQCDALRQVRAPEVQTTVATWRGPISMVQCRTSAPKPPWRWLRYEVCAWKCLW